MNWLRWQHEHGDSPWDGDGEASEGAARPPAPTHDGDPDAKQDNTTPPVVPVHDDEGGLY